MAHAPLEGVEYHPSFVPTQELAQETTKDVPSYGARGAIARGPLSLMEEFASFRPMHAFLPPIQRHMEVVRSALSLNFNCKD